MQLHRGIQVKCPPSPQKITEMMFVDVRGVVRQFSPGDYTLMHDGVRDVGFPTLDLVLHVGAASLEEHHGGQTVYVVRHWWRSPRKGAFAAAFLQRRTPLFVLRRRSFSSRLLCWCYPLCRPTKRTSSRVSPSQTRFPLCIARQG